MRENNNSLKRTYLSFGRSGGSANASLLFGFIVVLPVTVLLFVFNSPNVVVFGVVKLPNVVPSALTVVNSVATLINIIV